MTSPSPKPRRPRSRAAQAVPKAAPKAAPKTAPKAAAKPRAKPARRKAKHPAKPAAQFADRARSIAKTALRQAVPWVQRYPRHLVAAAAAAVLAIPLYLLLATPSWYQPPPVAPEQRQQVRNNLIAAEQAFTEQLRAGAPFVYHVHQDDLNQWIAMRREIYPLFEQITPPAIRDPFILFEQGYIRIAGRHRERLLGSVFSLDITAALEGDGLVLRADSARMGRLRIPFGLLTGSELTQPIEYEEEEAWPGSPRIGGDLLSGLHVGAKARWKNGGVTYRVVEVQVYPGRLDLTVEPLGRQQPREHKRH